MYLIISKRENIRHLGKESVLLHFVSQTGHIPFAVAKTRLIP